MIVSFERVLTAAELVATREQLARASWSAGLSAGPQALLAKHNEQLAESCQQLPELRQRVMRALNRNAQLLSAALPLKILPPNFNRYADTRNYYGPHTDSTLRPLPDGSYLRTDISATLFLSAPESYEGGELAIEDIYGTHHIKLAAGSLVIYPAGSIHEVKPVRSGERLACYMFMQSLVRDTEQRRHLYEMDLALMALRARHGEAEPVLVRLTGLYNNLLRRWSDC